MYAPGVLMYCCGMSEKDLYDICFGLDNGINFMLLSSVCKPVDVLDICELLEEKNALNVQISPKIESVEGIDNIDDILKVSDGLMVLRGDMGVEICFEHVSIV